MPTAFVIADSASPHPTHFGLAHSQFGQMQIAWNAEAICRIELGPECLPVPALERDDAFARTVANHLAMNEPARSDPLSIVLTGSPFRKEVLLAVAAIPRGETRTYSEIAAAIGRPTAIRAAASAVASNPHAILIPCHRVIRSDGQIGNYRWGSEIKTALLDWECVK